MAVDHRARIEELHEQLAALDGKVNQTTIGGTFDFDGARRSIMEQINWHKKQLIDDEGPYEFETQAI